VRTQRTFKAIVEALRDGAWHEVDDIEAATRYPTEWVDELRAEGVLEVREGIVTLVRLRPDAVG
jgi:hypothetical protein